MAMQTIKLNLVPHRSFWQMYHFYISWFALVFGGLILIGATISTLKLYNEIARSKKQLGFLAAKGATSDSLETGSLTELQNLDVPKELPMWQFAERVYAERSVTWSRLLEELEHSLVNNVRINSIVRSSFSGQGIKIGIVGEARSREAEVAFIESLKNNKFFEQIIFEKESERQGGGVLFTCTISAALQKSLPI
jgi:hypothetical protein